MAVAEVSIVPVGTDAPSFSSFVEAAANACRTTGVRHLVGPMATILEGEAEAIFACAQAMHDAALRSGAPRVITQCTIDERVDKQDTIESRLEAVTAPALQ